VAGAKPRVMKVQVNCATPTRSDRACPAEGRGIWLIRTSYLLTEGLLRNLTAAAPSFIRLVRSQGSDGYILTLGTAQPRPARPVSAGTVGSSVGQLHGPTPDRRNTLWEKLPSRERRKGLSHNHPHRTTSAVFLFPI
jgi:hypothetical protein